ncbi:MAG: hydrogenase maturation protease [Actinomycetota bacterium]|nr:hydrogenase maturation protease [Actinomycetota bacterium]
MLCIGNKARGDDGVARRVAELLEGCFGAEVTLVSQPQLDVVLAEDVAAADEVIFIDAERRAAPLVAVTDVVPDASGSNAHALDPSGLLALSQALYACAAAARLVSVAAPEMGHAEGLSAIAEAASHEAASEVLRMIGAQP